MKNNVQFETLKGKTLTSIKREKNDEGNETLIFSCNDGSVFEMYHEQDCCEDVYIESVYGDFNDLIGMPIVEASARTNEGSTDDDDTYTWTFYTISTIKGTVDIRWYGSSNGYYSESVSVFQVRTSN